MSVAPVLEATDITHTTRQGLRILNGVSLAVQAGTSTAISGRSGAGKSTLLAVLMGLLQPTHGCVTLNGHPLSGANRRTRARLRGSHIGVVFQHAELLAELTAVANVALPAIISGEQSASAFGRARDLLIGLDIEPERPAEVLSGGERQRVAIARAVINNPTLVLADEPTGALDTELRDAAIKHLYALPRSHNCALVIVTHDPDVAQHADTRLTMTNGVLTTSEPVPTHATTAPSA